MNIVCDKTLLSAAIDGVSKAVTMRSAIPVLEGILLKAEGFQLTLTGYDLEMGIVTTIEANVKEPGEIVLNAKLLSSMISRMPAGQISILSADNGKTTIKSGVAEFEIQSMAATDFPDLPNTGAEETLTIPTGVLRDMIDRTLYAVSQDEKKPAHTGELFEIEPDKLTIVALDGYRLAIVERSVTAVKDIRIIVPSKTMTEVAHLLPNDDEEPVHICANRRYVVFMAAGYTIMSRLIEGARTTIGTFKALGYGDGTILWYYLLHAVLVVAVGFPLGVLPVKPLIRLIVETLATGNDLPAYAIVYDYGAWLEALVITGVCCLGSASLVIRSLLRESPAQCMRPRPPGSTKPVLLERLPPLWRRLSFNQKYIVRNTLRNKARMLTCIIGIAFCMALVFAAFALRDSVSHYAAALTGNQNQYDLMVTLDSGVAEGQYRRLEGIGGVDGAEYEMSAACWIYTDSRMTTAALTVGEDVETLKLYNPYAPSPLVLPENGILLGRSLAEELDVAVGDTVEVRFAGDPRYYQIAVAEVDRTVTGAIVSRSFWRSLGRPYLPTGAYLAAEDREAVVRELERYDFVEAWQTRETVTDAAASNLNSAAMVAYILIVFGGGLACVVIYNLGIMSFFEQIRSLATLMVLGFYDREIKRLQLSENIIFAVAGICAGLPLGIALSYVILAVLKDMPLELATRPVSYILSCAVTLLFALIVNAVIGRKMREIDMLGALKSVE